MAVSRDHVAALWREHMRRPFPPRLRGEVIPGIDVVLLDTYIAGCVITWLDSQSDLDTDRQRILRDCLDDLRQVVPALTDPTTITVLPR